jgi:hypothetical protein
MLSDHIPDTGQHETIFHGEHANRIRTRVPYVRLKRLKVDRLSGLLYKLSTTQRQRLKR